MTGWSSIGASACEIMAARQVDCPLYLDKCEVPGHQRTRKYQVTLLQVLRHPNLHIIYASGRFSHYYGAILIN